MAKKTGTVFLETINKPATSLSPDDMKNYASDWVAKRGLNALTGSMQGTGQRAPMPRARRELFTHNYWRGTSQHPDNTLGDPFGTQTRKESTTGGRI